MKDVDGREARIVQVRNPWGSFEWKGDWGDASKIWSDSAKQQVKFVAADDGTFWMSLEDFKKYFTLLFVCKYHDGYVFNNCGFPHTDEGRYLFKMSVPSTGRYTLAVS